MIHRSRAIARALASALLLTVAAAACDRAPTEPAAAPPQDAAASESHVCSPYVTGPDSLGANATGTFTLWSNAGSGCAATSIQWSANNGAQVMWTSAIMSESLTGEMSALSSGTFRGSAGIKAGACDFDAIVSATFANGSSVNTSKAVRVRDCGPFGVSLSQASGGFGGILVSWTPMRADSFRVYRRMSPTLPWTHMATRTTTSWTDTAYRIAPRWDYTHYPYYKVEAYQNGGYFGLESVTSTWARSNYDID